MQIYPVGRIVIKFGRNIPRCYGSVISCVWLKSIAPESAYVCLLGSTTLPVALNCKTLHKRTSHYLATMNPRINKLDSNETTYEEWRVTTKSHLQELAAETNPSDTLYPLSDVTSVNVNPWWVVAVCCLATVRNTFVWWSFIRRLGMLPQRRKHPR